MRKRLIQYFVLGFLLIICKKRSLCQHDDHLCKCETNYDWYFHALAYYQKGKTVNGKNEIKHFFLIYQYKARDKILHKIYRGISWVYETDVKESWYL